MAETAWSWQAASTGNRARAANACSVDIEEEGMAALLD
jgi:hypothetical protein